MRGGQLYDKFWPPKPAGTRLIRTWLITTASPTFSAASNVTVGSPRQRGRLHLTRPENQPSECLLTGPHFDCQGQKTPQELFDALKSSTGRRRRHSGSVHLQSEHELHDRGSDADFSTIFTDDEFWDLVRFLKDEAVDVSTLYESQTTGTYPTGSIAYSNIGKAGTRLMGTRLSRRSARPVMDPTAH